MNAVNQRHNLVLVFTDLSGSTRIAANAEPELYAELIAELRGLTATIVERHGGEVVRIDGDGALCIFGYPIAHEDAGRRAVEAALDLHAAVATLETGLSGADAGIAMHTGIHAGVVLLRTGDVVSGRYEMLGDATNVAARLCDAAGPGEVLVSAETLGPDRHLFASGSERAVQVAGRRPPMQALPVTGRSAAVTRFAARTRDVLTPFTGRQAERAAFAQWLASLSSGASALLLHGPAGIGKSRLLGELADDAALAGWRTVRGYCEAYLGARPLQPFRQVARQLGAADGDGAAAFETAILQAATAAPLLVELDDWQWADDASRDLLASLRIAAEAAGLAGRLRLLLASREEPGAQGGGAIGLVVPLPPLSAEECRDTISVLLRSFDTFALKRIEQASGGSPLLIEELCHAFTGGSPAPDSDPRGSWFDLAVQARFARLDPADQDLLRLAAAIGHIVPTALLAAVRGEAIGGEALARLEQADFLFAGDRPDTLRFKHGLTRDAVYAATGYPVRIELHGQLAQTLLETRESSSVEALAYHLAASGDVAAALPYMLKAGDDALAAGALDRAQYQYKAAFDWLETRALDSAEVDQLRQVIKMFGRACVIDPEREHVSTFDRMLACAEKSGDREAITLATYWIGAHYYGLGEPRLSLAALEAAQVLVEQAGSDSFRIQVHANLGQSSAIAGRYGAALAHMDIAIAGKQAALRPGRANSSLAYCLSSRGLVRADMGDFDAAFGDFDASLEALAGHDETILPSLETQRCLALIYHGSFAEAVRRAEWSERRAVQARARFMVHTAQALCWYARYSNGEGDVWFDRFVDATLQIYAARRLQRISFKLGWIAEAMADRGELAMTRLFAKLAFERALKGDRLGEASAARALARCHARLGNRTETERYLAMAARAGRIRQSQREQALNLLCTAQCLALGGDDTRARLVAVEAEGALAALGMPQFARQLAALKS